VATVTQQNIVDLIDNSVGNYPYTIQFFQRKQRDVIYPSVEVVKVSSDSTVTDIQKTQTDQIFEIKFYLKYVRKAEDEERDRLLVENEIRNLLETANLDPPNKIFLEQKSWSHQVIDAEVFGSISTLRLTIRDVTSTSGNGLVGAGDIFEINSSGTPTQIPILAFNERDGLSTDSHINDDGESLFDPTHSESRVITVTYESTVALDSIVRTASYSRVEINCKITRGGTETKHVFLIGETTKSGSYDGVERATTNLYHMGTWV